MIGAFDIAVLCESRAELRSLVEAIFRPQSIEHELRLPPWRNNLAFLVRPRPPGRDAGAGGG